MEYVFFGVIALILIFIGIRVYKSRDSANNYGDPKGFIEFIKKLCGLKPKPKP